MKEQHSKQFIYTHAYTPQDEAALLSHHLNTEYRRKPTGYQAISTYSSSSASFLPNKARQTKKLGTGIPHPKLDGLADMVNFQHIFILQSTLVRLKVLLNVVHACSFGMYRNTTIHVPRKHNLRRCATACLPNVDNDLVLEERGWSVGPRVATAAYAAAFGRRLTSVRRIRVGKRGVCS
jgi:hypothetical protein